MSIIAKESIQPIIVIANLVCLMMETMKDTVMLVLWSCLEYLQHILFGTIPFDNECLGIHATHATDLELTYTLHWTHCATIPLSNSITMAPILVLVAHDQIIVSQYYWVRENPRACFTHTFQPFCYPVHITVPSRLKQEDMQFSVSTTHILDIFFRC